MIRLGRRMGDNAIARSGIVGIKTPGNAIADGIPGRGSGKAAYPRHGRKGAFENQGKGIRYDGPVGNQDSQSPQNVAHCHKGNHPLHNGGDPLESAGDGDKAGHAQHHGGNHGINAEALLQGPGDGFRLHAAGPGAQDEAGHRQHHRAPLPSQGILHDKRPVAHILIHGLAVFDPVSLSQNNFTGFGGHAQQAGDPHPEQGTGPAGHHRGGNTADVSHTDGIGHGGTRRRKAGNGTGSLALAEHPAIGIFPVERDLPEIVVEPEANAQIQAGSQQDDGHRRPPKEIGQSNQDFRYHAAFLLTHKRPRRYSEKCTTAGKPLSIESQTDASVRKTHSAMRQSSGSLCVCVKPLLLCP